MMMFNQPLSGAKEESKTVLKCPEGRYTLANARNHNLLLFSPHRATKLTLAELTSGRERATFIIFNVGDFLHVCTMHGVDKEPLRTIHVNAPGNALMGQPCAHDHCAAASDGYDLLIGLTSGDVVVASLHAQLMQPASNTKLVSLLHFNPDGTLDNTRCTAARWVPTTHATVFATAHASGHVYIHHRGFSSAAAVTTHSVHGGGVSGGGPGMMAKVGSGKGPTLSMEVPGGGVTCMAVSPDGRMLATTSKDGGLRLYDVADGRPRGGCMAYYGALLCCAWSPDGAYIAIGGEDDSIAIYSIAQRRCLAWGEGHNSWVGTVAWDPWLMPGREGLRDGAGHTQQQEGGGGHGDNDKMHGEASTANGDATKAATASGTKPPLLRHESVKVPEVYRVASGGQDCRVGMWDVDVADEMMEPLLGIHTLRGFTTSSSAADLASAAASAGSQSPVGGSWGGGTATTAGGLSLPPTRSEMPLLVPVEIRKYAWWWVCMGFESMHACCDLQNHTRRVHEEPLTDVLFTKDAVYTACGRGQVKCWRRP